MWCVNCMYGSEIWNPKGKCPQCSGDKMTEESPIPSRPTRSIRAMAKRKDVQKSYKSSKPISDDVQQVIKDAQHLQ